jgi:hypothetical protein
VTSCAEAAVIGSAIAHSATKDALPHIDARLCRYLRPDFDTVRIIVIPTSSANANYKPCVTIHHLINGVCCGAR